jgi:4-hydroxyproline epimerase
MKRIAVIDSHTGGEPTRVVLDGVLAEELQTYRRAILCEPRGSEVLVGALLQEANDPECAASVTFFNNVGLLGMCGHGMIGVVATLQHLGRLAAGVHRIQTPAGVVTVTLREDGRVSVENVLSHRRAAAVLCRRRHRRCGLWRELVLPGRRPRSRTGPGKHPATGSSLPASCAEP